MRKSRVTLFKWFLLKEFGCSKRDVIYTEAQGTARVYLQLCYRSAIDTIQYCKGSLSTPLQYLHPTLFGSHLKPRMNCHYSSREVRVRDHLKPSGRHPFVKFVLPAAGGRRRGVGGRVTLSFPNHVFHHVDYL